MNKKTVWIIIGIVVLLVIVAYVINKDSSDNGTGGLQINAGDEKTPQTGGDAGLVNPEDDFQEIDDAMNYVE